jgi:hypothetical protein
MHLPTPEGRPLPPRPAAALATPGAGSAADWSGPGPTPGSPTPGTRPGPPPGQHGAGWPRWSAAPPGKQNPLRLSRDSRSLVGAQPCPRHARLQTCSAWEGVLSGAPADGSRASQFSWKKVLHPTPCPARQSPICQIISLETPKIALTPPRRWLRMNDVMDAKMTSMTTSSTEPPIIL